NYGCTTVQQKGRNYSARPYRAEVNSELTISCEYDPADCATWQKKKRQIYCDDRVVRDMSRWKRGPGSVSIRLIGKANGWFLEQSHEFRSRLLQFDHSHVLHLLGTTTINGRFQCACKQLPDQQGQEKAYHELPPIESAKKERAEHNRNEQRDPNLDIAQRRHEQVERRTRPLSVNEMKNRMVHSGSLKL